MEINANAGDTKPQRRLSNFQIKEVSLVDEAANNHKFIIAKSKAATQKDAAIFNDDPKADNKSATTTKTDPTKKNVDPLTFAQMVLQANELDSDMQMFFTMVKDLTVVENGNFSMGPELTGRAVSMLEKLSDMLFFFGSESTLGFDSPALMAKSLLDKDKDGKKGVEKVGKPMNGKRLQKFEDAVKALQDGLTGLQGMLEEIKQSKEVSQMTDEQRKQKEAELQKRLEAAKKEKEAELRKELGLDDGKGDGGGEGDGAGSGDDAGAGGGDDKGKGDGAAAAVKSNEEVDKLKAQVDKLEKAEETRVAKSKEDADKQEVTDLKKRIADLEGAGGSNAGAIEDTDLEKNKGKGGDKTEYIEKNGRKVRKGLFKGLMGTPVKDVVANMGKTY